jgi:hypothetical protein
MRTMKNCGTQVEIVLSEDSTDDFLTAVADLEARADRIAGSPKSLRLCSRCRSSKHNRQKCKSSVCHASGCTATSLCNAKDWLDHLEVCVGTDSNTKKRIRVRFDEKIRKRPHTECIGSGLEGQSPTPIVNPDQLDDGQPPAKRKKIASIAVVDRQLEQAKLEGEIARRDAALNRDGMQALQLALDQQNRVVDSISKNLSHQVARNKALSEESARLHTEIALAKEEIKRGEEYNDLLLQREKGLLTQGERQDIVLNRQNEALFKRLSEVNALKGENAGQSRLLEERSERIKCLTIALATSAQAIPSMAELLAEQTRDIKAFIMTR